MLGGECGVGKVSGSGSWGRPAGNTSIHDNREQPQHLYNRPAIAVEGTALYAGGPTGSRGPFRPSSHLRRDNERSLGTAMGDRGRTNSSFASRKTTAHRRNSAHVRHPEFVAAIRSHQNSNADWVLACVKGVSARAMAVLNGGRSWFAICAGTPPTICSRVKEGS